MRRTVRRLCFAIAAALATAAVTLAVRSRSRADLVGIVAGRTYAEVQSLDGDLAVRVVRHWPTPVGWFWSAGPADFYDTWEPDARDPLVGPDFSLGTWWPGATAWERRAGRFAVAGGSVQPLADWSHRPDDGDTPAMRVPRRIGFRAGHFPQTRPRPQVMVTAPLWAVTTAACGPFALWTGVVGLAWVRRRRRRRRGLCLRCGYDRRHSSGRCPECGATAA